jgi:hypothetical protein
MDQSYASVAYVNFLFGIFCAYWAQSTRRSAWLWFFMGFLFGPFTGIFLAAKNADDLKKAATVPADAGNEDSRTD